VTEVATVKGLEDVQKTYLELGQRMKMILNAAAEYKDIKNKIAFNAEKIDDLAALRKEFNVSRKVNDKEVETASENDDKLDELDNECDMLFKITKCPRTNLETLTNAPPYARRCHVCGGQKWEPKVMDFEGHRGPIYR
jgi:hypothetical protein